MIAPFYKFGFFGEELSLVIAFIIGLGFGFTLERAGFGSSRKLAAQFYLTDMTVFKVMFTAIITAMLGVFFLSSFGFLDLSLITIIPTRLVPQAIGGLILGFGFVIGGYCPGTSMVGCSIGKIDAFFYILGVFIGAFIIAELFPYIHGFYTMTSMGKVVIPEYFGIPYGGVVFAVVVLAVAGFAGATWVEKKMAQKYKEGK